MGPRHNLSFCACKTACLASELLVSMGPSPHVCFCMQNSDFWTRIANLYGSQISPAVLCLQCRVSSIRITSLHGSQLSCVVFGCNRATFGQEKQVSMSPRHNLSLCACKIAWLAPELLLSMCPNPHLWFLDAKQRLLDRINKSLWVPGITCRFVHAKQRA